MQVHGLSRDVLEEYPLGNDIKAMSAAKWMSFLVSASFFDQGWKYINRATSKSSRKPELKELLGNVGVNIFGKRPRGKGACWNLYTACELWVGWRPGLSKQKIFPQVTQSCYSNVLLFPVLFPGWPGSFQMNADYSLTINGTAGLCTLGNRLFFSWNDFPIDCPSSPGVMGGRHIQRGSPAIMSSMEKVRQRSVSRGIEKRPIVLF